MSEEVKNCGLTSDMWQSKTRDIFFNVKEYAELPD